MDIANEVDYVGCNLEETANIAEILENTSKALVGVAIAFYFAAIVLLFLWVLFTGSELLYIGANLDKSNNNNLIMNKITIFLFSKIVRTCKD